jgi:hypothetical protein
MMMGCTMTIRVPTPTTLSSLATWTVCLEPILVSPCVLFHDLVLPVLTMIAHVTAQLVSKTTTKTTTNFDRLVSQVLARCAVAKIALSACFAVDRPPVHTCHPSDLWFDSQSSVTVFRLVFPLRSMNLSGSLASDCESEVMFGNGGRRAFPPALTSSVLRRYASKGAHPFGCGKRASVSGVRVCTRGDTVNRVPHGCGRVLLEVLHARTHGS